MLAIEAHELTKAFTAGRGRTRRTVEAVRDITFQVERGERLAYIGPNGAGKSTSIKMLTGILHPTSGRATVLGFELTTRQTLHLLARIYRLDEADARRRTGELAELLEASDLFDQPVRSLSLGQRMRCSQCGEKAAEVVGVARPTPRGVPKNPH